MTDKMLLYAISVDLKRISLSLYRKSYKTADRFIGEVLNHSRQIDTEKLKPYMAKIIENLSSCFSQENTQQKMEDILMYSIRIENYCKHNLKS